MTPKKGFDATPVFGSNTPIEPAFREEEPVRSDPEIDKADDSLIDVEDVKADSPLPLLTKKEVIIKEEFDDKSTRSSESGEDKETKTEGKKKYNPLDVANLTSKDPPKSRSPPRKKLLLGGDYCSGLGRFPRPWRPEGVYYGGEEVDYSVPITTAYLKHMRSLAFQERLDLENKVSFSFYMTVVIVILSVRNICS